MRRDGKLGSYCRDCGSFVHTECSGCHVCGSRNLDEVYRGRGVYEDAYDHRAGWVGRPKKRHHLEPQQVQALLGKRVAHE